MARHMDVIPCDVRLSAAQGAIWIFLIENEAIMRRRCRQLTRCSQDAEDAFSELRLRLFSLFDKEPERLITIDNVQAWLKRVATNLCIDRIRQSPVTCSLDWLDQDLYDSVTWQPLCYSPEHTASLHQSLEALSLAMDQLPVLLCEALELRCIEGAEYQNMASKLAISEQNARKRVQLARQQLRAVLGKLGKDNEGFE